jgi:primosomal protein N' (replication factor Y)
MIVIDESHEPAYKQEEGIRYHATRVASVIASEQKAQLILASATPLVGDMYMAVQKKRPIIRMTQSAVASDSTVASKVIDMKTREEFSTHPMLSHTLLKAIETALQNGEQSLVYLNRRGTARAILCHKCGWQAMCPNCDVSLTYHHDAYNLRCHTCGYSTSVPRACPTCHSSEILFKSAGTKALADWLAKHFSQATVARFDTDNLKAESLHERHADVASGKLDILVGTQMLVKGLDLQNLSVVGIVAADLSLQIPDFSAEERTYQLLCQAVGRVGRGHRSGSTIVQTFNPQNKVIQQALTKNYDAFYTTQIEQRITYHYSPLFNMATFWCSKKTAESALQLAQKVYANLCKISPETEFLGPVITFHPKKRAHATAQIVVKSTHRSELISLANQLPTGWQYDLEPTHLL